MLDSYLHATLILISRTHEVMVLSHLSLSNAYRQRNVFLYPPQLSSLCDPSSESSTVGDGDCGVNGNTKVFQAGELFFFVFIYILEHI